MAVKSKAAALFGGGARKAPRMIGPPVPPGPTPEPPSKEPPAPRVKPAVIPGDEPVAVEPSKEERPQDLVERVTAKGFEPWKRRRF